jgi:hypothetical protein
MEAQGLVSSCLLSGRLQGADQRGDLVEVGAAEAVAVATSFGGSGHDSRFAELAEVVGDERLAHAGHLLEFAYGSGAAGEPKRDQQPLLVSERPQRRRPVGRNPPALLHLYDVDRVGVHACSLSPTAVVGTNKS